MKRISRYALLTLFSMFLLLGSTQAFAGNGDSNNQGQNNQGGNNNNQGDNNQGDDGGSSGWSNGNPTPSGGGGTAPIDGGIGLLLAAGIGLGIRNITKRP